MDITRSLQRAVRDFPHGTKALAAALDMSPTTLSHKVSPTYPTQFCSPEEMLEIMRETGDNGPLVALADAVGCMVLPLPALSADGTDECTRKLLDAVKEFSDFTQATAESAAEDGISDNELQRIEAEGAQAIASIQKLMAWAAAKNAERKPAHLRAV
ncbi:MAG: hypothetical protein C0423_03315 [Methylibium sp.]|nr:hypothetical protein [Methylibium sp.]